MRKISAVREMYAIAPSAKIYMRMAGNLEADTVLIIIHGGPGLSHQYLTGLEQLAGPQLLVVSYDQRGCGRTTTTHTQKGSRENQQTASLYDLDPLTQTSDLETVRQTAVGYKKVHLLGHSWGGLLAMHYATLYPEHVRSLLLIDSLPPTLSGVLAGGKRFQQRLHALQKQGLVPDELSEDPLTRLKQIIPAYIADPTLPFPFDNWELNSTTESRAWKAVGNYDLRKSLAKLDIPVLILFGEIDPFGTEWAEETEAALRHARVTSEIISDCGHFGWIERSDLFLQLIHEFLRRNKLDLK